MTSDLPKTAWYEGDHVEGGFEVVQRLGRPRAEIVTASAGYNGTGEPQVLMLGRANVEILSDNGDLLLDVGDREIRALRLVRRSGIEVCITGIGTNGNSRPTRWMHRVSEADAGYLEQVWLDMPRHLHNGTQLNPLPWREDEYAYRAGRVVTEASRCDAALTVLVLSARARLEQPAGKIYGASGEPLADALDEIGAHSRAVADIGERYRAWYVRRNFAMHGIRGRDASGRPTSQVFKAKRKKPGQAVTISEEIFDQDFESLALLWQAFYALNHDAVRADLYFNIVNADADAKSALERIPMPDTVNKSERLPASAPPEERAE